MINRIFNIPRRLKKIYFIYFNRLKIIILNIQAGKNIKIYHHVYFNKPSGSTIIIGDNFIFSSGACHNPLSRNVYGCIYAEKGAKIKIGNCVGISSACIWAHQNITIGDNVKVGGDCIIMDSDAHSLNFLERRNPALDMEQKKNADIVIEDDVLIGTRSIILKGVHIGARTIIGAGSVVTGKIPSDCIAAGNPCRVIKK